MLRNSDVVIDEGRVQAAQQRGTQLLPLQVIDVPPVLAMNAVADTRKARRKQGVEAGHVARMQNRWSQATAYRMDLPTHPPDTGFGAVQCDDFDILPLESLSKVRSVFDTDDRMAEFGFLQAIDEIDDAVFQAARGELMDHVKDE